MDDDEAQALRSEDLDPDDPVAADRMSRSRVRLREQLRKVADGT